MGNFLECGGEFGWDLDWVSVGGLININKIKMTQTPNEFILNTLKASQKVKDDFFNHRVSIETSLLASQMQFFQNASSLVLAIIGIGIGTESLEVNFYLKVSIAATAILVIISLLYCREMIDGQAEDLDNIQKNIDHEDDKLVAKAMESVELKNASVFMDYVQDKVNKGVDKKQETETLYIGEIIVCLYLTSITFLFISILNLQTNNPALFSLGIFIVICVISFKNWVLPLIKKMSSIFVKFN